MRLLHLEDNPHDAALVRRAVESEWTTIDLALATNRKEFVAALQRGTYDVIVSDFNVPGLDGLEALALARQFRPECPVIFVSGTIGEDRAAELVRAGAADYLLKDRLKRLPIAIRHAVQETEGRRQRRVAEDRLHEQAELLDKVHDGVIVTTMEHRVIYWNRGAERIFGWTAEEVLGRSTRDLFGPTGDVTFAAMETRLLETGEWSGELSLANSSNRPLLADLRMTLVKGADGEPRSQLTIVTDITERKRLEEQLLRAHRLESLGMLAAGIAHDLNNALAPMLMAVGLLRTRTTDPGDLRLIELLEQSAQRGAGLVKQIVSFAGARTRDRVLVQTKHLMRDILQLVQDTFPKSIRLEHVIPNDLATVRGDPTQLHQVLLNLCINARDAMPSGGSLRLRAENCSLTAEDARAYHGALPGRYVVLDVTDSGTGIAPEVLEHIWDPFFTTKAEGQGTGLGLSTVRGIIVNHGGFVHVQSELGRGATFRVFLPAGDDGPAEPKDVSAVRQSGGRGRGELILVVDDQSSVRESICAVLAKNGYRFISVGDGIEALSQYADRIREVSLVITDLDMPGLNGVAFSQAIMRLNPALKVLFISGTGEAGVGGSAAPAGSVFLAKPFTPDALIAKVERLVHGVGV